MIVALVFGPILIHIICLGQKRGTYTYEHVNHTMKIVNMYLQMFKGIFILKSRRNFMVIKKQYFLFTLENKNALFF